MNKRELIEKLTLRAKACSKAETERFLESFEEIIKETLKRGEKVVISGFGTFSVKKRAPRIGAHPQTKKKIQIPSMRVVKFTAGQGLKRAVR